MSAIFTLHLLRPSSVGMAVDDGRGSLDVASHQRDQDSWQRCGSSVAGGKQKIPRRGKGQCKPGQLSNGLVATGIRRIKKQNWWPVPFQEIREKVKTLLQLADTLLSSGNNIHAPAISHWADAVDLKYKDFNNRTDQLK